MNVILDMVIKIILDMVVKINLDMIVKINIFINMLMIPIRG